jgi:Phage tail sheath protein subtilisin-like domain
MGKVLIIPGVSVSVVKDVLPQQLAPSGVLGLVGFTGGAAGTLRAASWNRVRELCGDVTAFSLPEARQAIDNGVSELVIVSLPGAGFTAGASLTNGDANKQAIKLKARAGGLWANSLDVVVSERTANNAVVAVDLAIARRGGGDTIEQLRNVTADKLSAALATLSLVAQDGAADGLPKAGTYALTGGKDAAVSDYQTALDALREEADVDSVLAAVQDFSKPADVIAIYSSVIAHCNNLSGDAKGRIGFGQIGPQWTVASAKEAVSNLVSDRFVLVAPHGVVGAVAGLVGNLSYFQSPTFKALAGLGPLARALKVEEQTELLKSFIVPVATERGRGTIVVRALTTDGDQISVRRVADRAVRTMKMIGDLFIGRLNNADGRGALKQKLIEALLQMQREGAIVPSTDGKDPAFKVDVYSSQEDFAKGIVRVDMAVRPVRAIDYIYATVLVQV